MDPAVLGHAVYRPLLQAMARPGTVHPLPPGARDRPLLRLVGALLDAEVTFHVPPGGEELRGEVARETRSRPAPAETADFLLFTAGDSGGAVLRAKRGTLEYPDGGATLVYAVRHLAAAGGPVALRGPGIRDVAAPRLEGLAPGELDRLRQANAEYPLGVDAVFLDEAARVLCIPRSTRIGGR